MSPIDAVAVLKDSDCTRPQVVNEGLLEVPECSQEPDFSVQSTTGKAQTELHRLPGMKAREKLITYFLLEEFQNFSFSFMMLQELKSMPEISKILEVIMSTSKRDCAVTEDHQAQKIAVRS